MAAANTRITIVEDDLLLAYEWLEGLKAHGYDVTHHSTTEAAILHCTAQWPDLVVVDAFFETSDGRISPNGGVTFCADLLRIARDSNRQCPIVVGVSGSRVSQYMPRHVFEGVSRKLMPVRLSKPFSTHTLIDEVERLLGAEAALSCTAAQTTSL